MKDLCSDQSAVFLENNSSIPTQSGCLLKKASLRLRSDRKRKWNRSLPFYLALIICLLLGWPACPYASDKLNIISYETALQKVEETHQPLFIFFTSPWCYQCTEMERKVFSNKEIISLLNERFLPVEVDISQEKNLKETFLINYTPTSLFLDNHGKPIMNVKGYIPKNRLRKLLRYVSEGHYKTIPFSEFENK